MKDKVLTVFDLFEKYDKDKSYLLDINELAVIINDLTGYEINIAEKELIKEYSRKASGQTMARTNMRQAEVEKML